MSMGGGQHISPRYTLDPVGPAKAPPRASSVVRAFVGETSQARLVIGLIATAVLCAALIVFPRLGASWPVVVVAAVGTIMTFWPAHVSGARALALGLIVGCVGLVGIEIVNEAQYGTLSLSGPPAKVWWCGDTYSPSGSFTTGLGDEDGPPYVQLLTTPADYSVYGTFNGQPGISCGATGPLLVQVGSGKYKIYNP